jgi:N-acetylneuraminate lyase
MQFSHLEGLIAAPFTPMSTDGELNLALIPAYYQLLKSNHVSGAFICGSTGEGVSLTQKEKMAVAEAWASCSAKDPDFKIITLVGGTSVNECKELAAHAEQHGLFGIALTSPFYFKPGSVQMLAETCSAVADAAPGTAFYYYHIPVLTGVGFPMLELLELVDGQIPNFAGIKYTHEDFMDFTCCLNFAGGKYDMLWGRDECWLPALSLGAKGAVGSTYNYAAPIYHAITAAFHSGDLEKARSLQQQAIEMIRLLGKYGGIATGKAYMKLIGLDCGNFRLPIKNMSHEKFLQFKEEVEAIGFYRFSSAMGALSTN